MKIYRNTVITLAVIAFCGFLHPGTYDSIDDPGAKEIADEIRNDQRSPTKSDISGAWGTNPYLRGALNHFSITEEDEEIHGVWISTGSLMVKTYKVTGTRDENTVMMDLYEDDEKRSSHRFEIVDYQGTVALSSSGERYPITPYMERDRIREAVKKERSNESLDTTRAKRPELWTQQERINPTTLSTGF